jgi:hypothetical protein
MEDLRFSRRWLWRMASSGMLCRVALVRADVSEELGASFRVTRIGELVTTLALTNNRLTLRSLRRFLQELHGVTSQKTPFSILNVRKSVYIRLCYIFEIPPLEDRRDGVHFPVRSRIFVSPYRPDPLWGPPSLLYNGCRGLFPQNWSLAHASELIPRPRKHGSIHPLTNMPSRRGA